MVGPVNQSSRDWASKPGRHGHKFSWLGRSAKSSHGWAKLTSYSRYAWAKVLWFGPANLKDTSLASQPKRYEPKFPWSGHVNQLDIHGLKF